MSGPFKMKYQGSPLSMFGGAKSSPARSWWNKMFGQNRAAKEDLSAGRENGEEGDEGGGISASTIPQHGSEAHSGRGKGGGSWMDKTFGGNLSGMSGGGFSGNVSGGGNNQNPMDLFKRMFGGGGGGMF